MLETVRWVSFVLMWIATGMNLWGFHRGKKWYKRTMKAYEDAKKCYDLAYRYMLETMSKTPCDTCILKKGDVENEDAEN